MKHLDNNNVCHPKKLNHCFGAGLGYHTPPGKEEKCLLGKRAFLCPVEEGEALLWETPRTFRFLPCSISLTQQVDGKGKHKGKITEADGNTARAGKLQLAAQEAEENRGREGFYMPFSASHTSACYH